MGDWVMSQLDARHGRGYSSVESLNRLPAMMAPDERDGTISLGQNHMLLPVRSAAPAAIGKAGAVLPAQAVNKLQGVEMLTRRLRSVAFKNVVESFGPMDQAPQDGPMICGRLLLRSDDRRAYWNGRDVGVSFREYNLIDMLVSDVGQFKTYRAIYDRLHYKGFIAGSGT